MTASRFIKLWFALLFALALSACKTAPVVTKHDTVVLAPQDTLLLDCPVATPPNKDEYVTMTDKEKEKAMAAWGMQQTLNLGLCNKDKGGLRKWKQDESVRMQGESK